VTRFLALPIIILETLRMRFQSAGEQAASLISHRFSTARMAIIFSYTARTFVLLKTSRQMLAREIFGRTVSDSRWETIVELSHEIRFWRSSHQLREPPFSARWGAGSDSSSNRGGLSTSEQPVSIKRPRSSRAARRISLMAFEEKGCRQLLLR